MIKATFLDDYYIERGAINSSSAINAYLVKDKVHCSTACLAIAQKTDLFLSSKKEPVVVKVAWRKDAHAGKGIIENLFKFLNEELNLALISDYTQSAQTKKVWSKFIEILDVKTVDMSTSSVFTLDKDLINVDPRRFAMIVDSSFYK